MGPVGSQGGSGSEEVTPFFKKEGSEKDSSGGLGSLFWAQQSRFCGKKSRARATFFFDFGGKKKRTKRRKREHRHFT